MHGISVTVCAFGARGYERGRVSNGSGGHKLGSRSGFGARALTIKELTQAVLDKTRS